MIEVIGVGADGQLDDHATAALDAADAVVSSPRLLALLPARGSATRHPWPTPLLAGLRTLFADHESRHIVVLATGDPLQSGIATTLIREFGRAGVIVRPAVGSVALARARLGWSAEQTEVVSLLTSPPAALRRHLTPGRRVLLLSPDAETPGLVADELVASGWPDASMTVLADLGTDHEVVTTGIADSWDAPPGSPLNIVAFELPLVGPALGTSPGLPDALFDNDGQLTKWELRAIALASLRPMPGELLWDLGAGAGSIGIEWALQHPRNTTIAVERDAARAARITANALNVGAVNVRVRRGASSEIIADLPDPDAIFVGGGFTADLLDECFARLRPGGRLVAHTVTLDSESILIHARARFGGDLRRISVERAEPLGRYLSWTPARAVTHWATTKQVEKSVSH